jgi:NAD-dependent DNA ligase
LRRRDVAFLAPAHWQYTVMQSATFFTGQDALMRHQGRQLCYQDHIVNFRQDITEIATRLPRLPDDTDIVVIRKEDVDLSRHVDFTVRRAKVKAALKYKIAHDPSYADLLDH